MKKPAMSNTEETLRMCKEMLLLSLEEGGTNAESNERYSHREASK